MTRLGLALLVAALGPAPLRAAPPPKPEPCDEARAVREIGEATDRLAAAKERAASLPEDERQARENELGAPAKP